MKSKKYDLALEDLTKALKIEPNSFKFRSLIRGNVSNDSLSFKTI